MKRYKSVLRINENKNKYSVVKVGGFQIGDYPSISAAKKAIKGETEKGLYQIIDNTTGLAVTEITR